jgi:alpha-L-fucosidase 2
MAPGQSISIVVEHLQKGSVFVKTSRREFLQTSALASIAAVHSTQSASPEGRTKEIPTGKHLNASDIARRHMLVRNLPSPSLFDGMLLGNGDVGTCVVVRPDALAIHVGKNDCWDIRVSEDIAGHVLPFRDVLQLWQRASVEAKKMGKPDLLYLETKIDFFREYSENVASSYDGKKWPRPWPCGTIWINWDPTWITPGRHTLDLATGLFELTLDYSSFDKKSSQVQLSVFVDWESGLISASTDHPLPLRSVVYSPEVDGFHAGFFDSGKRKEAPEILPAPETSAEVFSDFVRFDAYQYLPALGPTADRPSPPTTEKDRNFSLSGRISGRWSTEPGDRSLDLRIKPDALQLLRIDAFVATPRDSLLKRRLQQQAGTNPNDKDSISIPQDHAFSQEDLNTKAIARQRVAELAESDLRIIRRNSELSWNKFWSRSAVEFNDRELERFWYENQYFLACCLRPNKVAPGLFANWSTGDIGTSWHGDYHADYNCEQVYWGVFSSNHVEQHLPFVELCENILPIATKFATEHFGLPGAMFPVSTYPAPSQIVAYPVPPWAYQFGMTPWMVQSLWWQYLYTQDEDYLRRVYPILREAARFIAAYVKKTDDNKYHFSPTVSSENWGFTVDQRLNQDSILDLALTQFLFKAVVDASLILAVDGGERAQWSEICANLAPYPTATGPDGEIWVDVVNAPVGHVYNIPISLAPVFPGEQVGIGLNNQYWDIAKRTARTISLEGGNDLVFQPLIRARLGMLDFEWFKKEVQYCSLPNDVANDRVRQSGGRYAQALDFDYMMHMGFWCENFSLPAVLNECMMQSYTGSIRVFPNTHNLGPARFENLRAVGAFLVSADYDGKNVTHLSMFSEKGKTAKLASPWTGKGLRVIRSSDQGQVQVTLKDGAATFDTRAGETYQILPT